jgi:sarcosine oxidase / L-pipecolate oxidase
MPVIGRIVADAIEGTLDPEIVQKFAVHRSNDMGADWFSRRLEPTGRADLATERLSTPEDLLP